MLKEIYYGNAIPWERRSRKNEEHRKIVRKIEDEERYLAGKMSEADCERLQKLSNLYTELLTSEECDIFSNGFAMGLLLMMDVMEEANTMKIG